MQLRNFSIWAISYKPGEKKEKSPDYRLTAKTDKGYIEVGAAWRKNTTDGKQYISCSLAKPYNDKKGYSLIEETADPRIDPEDQGLTDGDINFDLN